MGLWCSSGTGVCLSVHTINLLTVVAGTVLLVLTNALPHTAWARLGLAQANRQTVYGGDVTLFWGWGKRLTVRIQAVPSLLASGLENSLQFGLFTNIDLVTLHLVFGDTVGNSEKLC